MNKAVAFIAWASCVAVAAMSGAGHAQTLATPLNPSQFVGGKPPSVGNKILASTGYVVCYQTFCSMNSSATKSAVWSAEHLTPQQIANARGADRESMTFFPDPHIPASASAVSSNYTKTGYDRGHMAPWADSADPNCFTLANIVPQNPDNNRHLWQNIEKTTRNMVSKYGDIYVVTGPIYEYNTEPMNGVAVPTGIYKAVYIPAYNKAAAYIVHNTPGNWWKQIPIASLMQLTHTDPFPALPDGLKMEVNTFDPPMDGRHPIPQEVNDWNGGAVTGGSSEQSSSSSTFKHEAGRAAMKMFKHYFSER